LSDEFRENKVSLIILAGAIGGALIPALWGAATAAGTLFIALAPFMLAGVVIAGMVAGAWYLYNNWEQVKTKLFATWSGMSSNLKIAIRAMVAMLTLGMSEIILVVLANKDAIIAAFTNVFDGAKQAVSGAIDWMIEKIKSLLTFIKDIPKMVGDVAKNIGGKIGGAVSGLFGGFRAKGGSVSGGTSYVVGEDGPEMFTPSVNGSITPNNQMGGGVTINISGVFGSDAADELGDMIVNRLAGHVAI